MLLGLAAMLGTGQAHSGDSHLARMRADREIQQLTATIDSGSLSGDALLDALRRRGILYVVTGRKGLGNQDLDVVLEANKKDWEALFARGLSQLSHPDRAIATFSRVISLDPKRIDGFRARALAKMFKGSFPAAAGDFLKILGKSPADLDALHGLGWAKLFAGHYDAAVEAFRKAIRSSDGSSDALLGRGLAYYFGGNLEEARADFRSAMRMRPRPHPAVTFHGMHIDHWRRYRQAIELIEQTTKRSQENVDAWIARGVASYRQIDCQNAGNQYTAASYARQAFDRAVAIAPDDVDALMTRALLYATPFISFNRSKAIADLTEVIRLQPDHTEAYFRRALLHGTDPASLASAVEDCEKALALAPGEPNLEAILAELKVRHRSWHEQQQRIANSNVRRQRHTEDAAAAFLASLAVLIVTRDPTQPPPPEDKFERAIMDFGWDLLNDRSRNHSQR